MRETKRRRAWREFTRLADLGRLLGHTAPPRENGCLACGVEFKGDIARHQFNQGAKYEREQLAAGRTRTQIRDDVERLWVRRLYLSTTRNAPIQQKGTS